MGLDLKIIFSIMMLIFLGVVSSGCDDSVNEPIQEPVHKLQGGWAWIRSEGGYPPTYSSPATVGYNLRVEFTPDSLFRRLKNDTILQLEARYWIVFDRDSLGMFAYADSGSPGSVVEFIYGFFAPDSLVLGYNASDAGFSYYVRQ